MVPTAMYASVWPILRGNVVFCCPSWLFWTKANLVQRIDMHKKKMGNKMDYTREATNCIANWQTIRDNAYAFLSLWLVPREKACVGSKRW